MKKTFRKAIAVLLSVLMVAFSVPFTAFAGEIGWWGDNEWNGVKNDKIPTSEPTDYAGWNSADWDLGLAWGDNVAPLTEWDMSAEAYSMLTDVYKPTLTVSVWDQGTTDNRIYREFYGYGTSITNAISYETAVANGRQLNPAQLKAGQRIAVVFEIGGMDCIYSGQLKGCIDTDYLAFGYYSMKPTTKDTWKQCTDSQTTQAGLTKPSVYYGSVIDDGTGALHSTTGTFVCPAGCKANPPYSQYVGADQREFGHNGTYICAYSMEVLKDCDLTDVLRLDIDAEGSAAYATTFFMPYAESEMGTEKVRYTFDTTDTKYTVGLIALNWDGYDANASTECTHANTEVRDAVEATCTTEGYTGDTWCLDCGEKIADGQTIPATNHSYEITADTTSSCTVAGKTTYT
ncbi:MAG: hypothetical protein PUE08_07680, partial [Eubacteriales bacterium]|nr:hypothetical protein [Eubacteriales bacterium]